MTIPIRNYQPQELYIKAMMGIYQQIDMLEDLLQESPDLAIGDARHFADLLKQISRLEFRVREYGRGEWEVAK